MLNSTTYEQPSIASARKMALSPRSERFYSRYGSPSVAASEDAMAELEGAESARAFWFLDGSHFCRGAGAVLNGRPCGRHTTDLGGTRQLLQGPCARFGIDVTWVDGTEPGATLGR
ncbi:MAG: PLP-dependent transferase [Acidimicrobiales bacterium]